MRIVLQVVFWVTCAALALVLCGVVWGAIAGAAYGQDYVVNSGFASLLKQILPIWIGGAGILWIYGFVVLGRGWASRTTPKNLLLLFVLLFFSTLVSPYYYWKRESL
jgi:hypothetical protein